LECRRIFKGAAAQRLAYQDTPYTVFACDAVGATFPVMENPVVDTLVTAVISVPVTAVVGLATTMGVDGSVDPKVTVSSVPAAVDVPDPKVSDPRMMVALAATAGAGGDVPAPAAAAAVTVVVSHGE
jgi:hypothetical protein